MIQYAVLQQLKLQEWLKGLFDREEGQDMIEYALLAALISIFAIAVILLIGPKIVAVFQNVVNGLSNPAVT